MVAGSSVRKEKSLLEQVADHDIAVDDVEFADVRAVFDAPHFEDVQCFLYPVLSFDVPEEQDPLVDIINPDAPYDRRYRITERGRMIVEKIREIANE